MLESLPFLSATYVGQPVWLWMAFLAFIIFLLWVDLGLVNRKDGVVSAKKSALMWASFASLAIAFGAYVYFVYEPDPIYYISAENLNQQAVIQYFTGYLLETALAFDNIFVIGMIFTFFAVPREYQHRVLFWGIFGALVLRAIFIFAGVALIEKFEWILYIFGAFLLYTAFKLVRGDEDEMDPGASPVLRLIKKVVPSTDQMDGQKLFTRITGKRLATPLFAVLVLVEATDVIFAVDSVPAVLAVSHEQFIVFSSNAFAILGLRALYFLLADLHARFSYLQQGLAIILAFVGLKMIIAQKPIEYHIPTWLSLMIIGLVLAVSISISLRQPMEHETIALLEDAEREPLPPPSDR